MKETYYFISNWKVHKLEMYYNPTESDICYYVVWNMHNGLVEYDGFKSIQQIRLILKYFNAKEREEDLI